MANAHHQILQGNLTAAKQASDAYDRVVQRSVDENRFHSGYYGLLIAWAEHPDQNIDAIRSAIDLLEGNRVRHSPSEDEKRHWCGTGY